MINGVVSIKPEMTLFEGRTRLLLNIVVNEKLKTEIKNSQLQIVILTRTPYFKIFETNYNNFTIEDKKINLNINNFMDQSKYNLYFTFDCSDSYLVEMIKVSYKYLVNSIF